MTHNGKQREREKEREKERDGQSALDLSSQKQKLQETGDRSEKGRKKIPVNEARHANTVGARRDIVPESGNYSSTQEATRTKKCGIVQNNDNNNCNNKIKPEGD